MTSTVSTETPLSIDELLDHGLANLDTLLCFACTQLLTFIFVVVGISKFIKYYGTKDDVYQQHTKNHDLMNLHFAAFNVHIIIVFLVVIAIYVSQVQPQICVVIIALYFFLFVLLLYIQVRPIQYSQENQQTHLCLMHIPHCLCPSHKGNENGDGTSSDSNYNDDSDSDYKQLRFYCCKYGNFYEFAILSYFITMGWGSRYMFHTIILQYYIIFWIEIARLGINILLALLLFWVQKWFEKGGCKCFKCRWYYKSKAFNFWFVWCFLVTIYGLVLFCMSMINDSSLDQSESGYDTTMKRVWAIIITTVRTIGIFLVTIILLGILNCINAKNIHDNSKLVWISTPLLVCAWIVIVFVVPLYFRTNVVLDGFSLTIDDSQTFHTH